MDNHDCDDAEFVENITHDVLGVLQNLHFFELLDDRYCPQDDSGIPAKCGHSFTISIEILHNLRMDSDDIPDVIAVLQSKGGCCDCEVLYNVAEESRLKARYWKARYAELQSQPSKPS
jgi:hypothetical protein